MAMGNTERAWTDFYDKHYQRRECQAGIQAMAAWRSGMLARARPNTTVPVSPSVPVASCGPEVQPARNARSATADDICVILDSDSE